MCGALHPPSHKDLDIYSTVWIQSWSYLHCSTVSFCIVFQKHNFHLNLLSYIHPRKWLPRKAFAYFSPFRSPPSRQLRGRPARTGAASTSAGTTAARSGNAGRTRGARGGARAAAGSATTSCPSTGQTLGTAPGTGGFHRWRPQFQLWISRRRSWNHRFINQDFTELLNLLSTNFNRSKQPLCQSYTGWPSRLCQIYRSVLVWGPCTK